MLFWIKSEQDLLSLKKCSSFSDLNVNARLHGKPGS